ncbi:hypothetical protein BURK1_02027 [Burkholderiales bacterium]|nr:hypothetical protein BURK1_02027 [Burkholderiales bacterium]
MTATTFAAAWRRVAVKQGVGLGALAGARGEEFAAVVAAASLAIPADRAIPERDVNDRLLAWLAGPGAMLATDHVELRRWLVDLGLLERDGYGREYRRSVTPTAFADAVAAMATIDPDAVAARSRADFARERAERRARHESRSGGSR